VGWNYERSKKRLAKEATRLGNAGLTVTRLTREMDLSNLAITDTGGAQRRSTRDGISKLG